jgi:hypothetical protein
VRQVVSEGLTAMKAKVAAVGIISLIAPQAMADTVGDQLIGVFSSPVFIGNVLNLMIQHRGRPYLSTTHPRRLLRPSSVTAVAR